jgi:hypothetical protein
MNEWARIHFDKQAVENGEPARLISTFREKVPVDDSDEVRVFRILPIGDECTFLFSPGAELLGASVLEGVSRTRCDRPDPQTQRLMKII